METEIMQLIQASPASAYLAVLGMLLLCGFGLPIPEDITLIAGGYTVYLSQQAHLSQPSLIPMIVVAMIGVLAGDTTLFLLGRWMGPRVTHIWPFRRLISPRRMEAVHQYFRKYGAWTAFIVRFAAGLRAPTYLLAGTARMRFRTFFLADGAAALLSVPALILLAWAFGEQIDRVKAWLANSRYTALLILVVVALLIIYRVIKGRRNRSARAGGNTVASEN